MAKKKKDEGASADSTNGKEAVQLVGEACNFHKPGKRLVGLVGEACIQV